MHEMMKLWYPKVVRADRGCHLAVVLEWTGADRIEVDSAAMTSSRAMAGAVNRMVME